MSRYKTIGILGGMGPEATAELYKRIIAIYQQRYGAIDDSDFPNIIINSLAVEDMLNDLANRRKVIIRQLQDAAITLERAGAQFIAIPCNTATIFFDDIRSEISIPVLDIIELTSAYVESIGAKKVGMLASTSTISSRIYENKLQKYNVGMIKPTRSEQAQVNNTIMRILAGEKNQEDAKRLTMLAESLSQRGADAVVLGCTELPLLISDSSSVQLIDTIQVLAEETVRDATREKSRPLPPEGNRYE